MIKRTEEKKNTKQTRENITKQNMDFGTKARLSESDYCIVED